MEALTNAVARTAETNFLITFTVSGKRTQAHPVS
jgi:hypothetical protein